MDKKEQKMLIYNPVEKKWNECVCSFSKHLLRLYSNTMNWTELWTFQVPHVLTQVIGREASIFIY